MREFQYDGPYLEWFESGELKRKYNYVSGKFEGEQVEYFANGELKMRTFYRDAARDGTYEEWYENGNLLLDETGELLSNLSAGLYEVQVTDNNNNETATESFEIMQPCMFY